MRLPSDFLSQIRRQPLWGLLALALAIQIATAAIMPVYVTFDSAAMLHNMEHCRAIFRFRYPLFGFPLLGVLTGVGFAKSIVGLFAAQSAMTVAVVLITVRLALLESRATAMIAGTALIASLAPFIMSMCIMNDHLYLTLLIAMAGCYAALLWTGENRYAIGLAVCLWLAQHTRPTGNLLQIVVALAIVASLVFHREQITPRLRVISRAAVLYILLVAVYALLAFIGASLFTHKPHETAVGDPSGRWLFCQIYSRGTGKTESRVSLEDSPTARIMAAAVREELHDDPKYLKYYAQTIPSLFARYHGDSNRLADDLIQNNPPDWVKPVMEQRYCWVILNALDHKFGAERANQLLTAAWGEIVWHRPDIWKFYAGQAWSYFFRPPDERNSSLVSNDIGADIVSPRLYAQIYRLANLRQTPFTAMIYRYALSFCYFVTPVLSCLALLGLPLVFSRRRIAPVLVLLWGIVLYHGFATAIANVVTMRYVVVIYPELMILAAVGLMETVRFVKSRCAPGTAFKV